MPGHRGVAVRPLRILHLVGGLATFSLLLWLTFRSGAGDRPAAANGIRRLTPLILLGLAVLVVQLALGGWTSANYSALACPDFPACHGKIWPDANFSDGFILWREVGVDYEGGVLDLQSRVAIHMAHRIGALFTLIILGILAIRLMSTQQTQRAGVVLGALLLTQVTLGILNVLLHLPLVNAVAHNGAGALLLATMIWLLHRSADRPA